MVIVRTRQTGRYTRRWRPRCRISQSYRHPSETILKARRSDTTWHERVSCGNFVLVVMIRGKKYDHNRDTEVCVVYHNRKTILCDENRVSVNEQRERLSWSYNKLCYDSPYWEWEIERTFYQLSGDLLVYQRKTVLSTVDLKTVNVRHKPMTTV